MTREELPVIRRPSSAVAGRDPPRRRRPHRPPYVNDRRTNRLRHVPDVPAGAIRTNTAKESDHVPYQDGPGGS